MNWYSITIAVYIIIVIAVLIRILFETHSTSKTLAYILFCVFIPVFGILFYLTFGINYWKKKRYSKKMRENGFIIDKLRTNIGQYDKVMQDAEDTVKHYAELSNMLLKDLGSPLTKGNKVKLLANGETKFPELLDSIRSAKHHIHLEYYIYECDETGMSIIDLLIEKAKEGVKVRFIYDDFGSPGIKSSLEKKMREAGIEIFAFHKIKFYLLANRFNYRNHRKIVVIDGCTAFVGGINVSDKYVNKNDPKKLFWRDTHIKIEGPAVFYLQYLFITDWNFCCGDAAFEINDQYFPAVAVKENGSYVQIAAGGPDSPSPSILYTLLQAINLAKEEILITTPYFIPGDSIMDALCMAALSGLKVKLLVPGISDSKLVNAAARSYYNQLLRCGVDIYCYQKGFVHAKTIVTDRKLSMIGTANMDYRSFELNFEVNGIVYDNDFAEQMAQLFFEDLKDARQIDKDEWLARPLRKQLPEKVARLFSPVL